MKRISIGAFSLLFAVACFAFIDQPKEKKATTTLSKEKKAVTSHWYQFNGDPTDLNEVLDESNYVVVSQPAGCSSNQYVCAIFVPGDDAPNSNPDGFTQTIQDDLEAAFNRTAQASYIEMKANP